MLLWLLLLFAVVIGLSLLNGIQRYESIIHNKNEQISNHHILIALINFLKCLQLISTKMELYFYCLNLYT